mgnify:CR=1 FL=1
MLRTSLIPVLVALMIAVGTMGLAHARTESPIDAPITVKELTDSPEKLAAAGYEMVMASGEDHAARAGHSPKASEELPHRRHHVGGQR